MSGVTYRSMYWWVSGELERLRIREAQFPGDDAVRLAAVRADAVLRLVGWCEDHAEDIKEIAARDKAKKQQASRRRQAVPKPKQPAEHGELDEPEPSTGTSD